MNNNKAGTTAKKVALVGLASLSTAAHATPISITDSFSMNTKLGTGSPSAWYSGQFNINDYLAVGDTIDDYQIHSARVRVSGYSDMDKVRRVSTTGYGWLSSSNRYVRESYTYYVSYRCGFWNGSTCYSRRTGYYYKSVTDTSYRRNETTRYEDLVRDRMTLNVGSQQSSAQVYQVQSSTSSPNRRYDYSSGYYSSGYKYFYTDLNTQHYALYGQLNTGMNLASLNIDNLQSNGLLNFNVFAQVGQFRLNNIALDVNMTRIASNTSAVTAPATFFLMLTAAGFGVIRRFNSKGQAVKM